MGIAPRRRQIVFAGLCQTQALSQIYAMHIAPFRDEDVTYVKLHTWLDEAEVSEALPRIKPADVLVEQVFDGPSRIPDTLLGDSVRRVLHPYLNISFLWPYSTRPHPANESFPWLEAGPYGYEMGDTYLNRLLRDKISPAEALQRYLDHDIITACSFERLTELNLHAQRLRDARTEVRFADFIESRFRHERLLYTKGHPTPRVMRLLAEQVFALLDVPPSWVQRALASPVGAPYFANELPLHPRLVEDLRLPFIAPDQRYRYGHEGLFTFDQYVLRYMDYVWDRQLGEGIARANQGEDERALPLLTAALTRCPTSVVGWRLLARLQRKAGQYGQAHASLGRAAHLDPGDTEVSIERTRLLMAEGRFDEAERIAAAAITAAPLAAGIHEALADVHDARAQKHADARVAMTAAGTREVLADIHRAGEHRRDAARVAVIAANLAPGDAHLAGKTGRYLWAADDPVEAERMLCQALALNPGLTHARGMLADLLEHGGRHAEALGHLQHLMQEQSSAHLQFTVANLLRRAGDLPAAEHALREALALDSELPGAANILIGVLIQQGRADEATALLRQLAADSDDAHLHHRLGIQLIQNGDDDGAQTALRRCLELDHGMQGALKTLVQVLERAGRDDDALALLRERVGAIPDAQLQYRLGIQLRRTGELSGAECALQRAVELQPTLPGAANVLAGVLMETGRADEAIRVLQPLASTSEDAHLHHRLGVLLEKAGDLAGAEIALRRSIELDEHQHGAIKALTDIFERNGRRDDALQLLEHAATGIPDAHMQFTLGNLRRLAGNLASAEHALRYALKLKPTYPGAANILAGILMQVNRHGEALDLLRFHAAESRDPHLHHRLGILQFRADALVDAEKSLRRSIELDPGLHGALDTLAGVLEREGRSKEAIRLLEPMAVSASTDGALYERWTRLSAGPNNSVVDAGQEQSVIS